jgi:hypothetical protein
VALPFVRALLLLCILPAGCGRSARLLADAPELAPGDAHRDTPNFDASDRDTWTPESRVLDPEADRALAPIPPQPLFTNLVVPAFPEAVVSVPNGATSVRPVVVVLHGSGDRPDWNCDAWRHITDAHGFVLCPRGDYVPLESTAGDRRYTLRGGAHLRAYLEGALEALATRFAGYVDVERPIVTGFSLGATEIAQLALSDPARFPRIAVLEGGYNVWTPSAVAAFAARGGLRVLFGCGSTWCMPPAQAAVKRLNLGDVQARLVFAAVGHTNDRPLQEALMAERAWFFDGDARWSGPP